MQEIVEKLRSTVGCELVPAEVGRGGNAMNVIQLCTMWRGDKYDNAIEQRRPH